MPRTTRYDFRAVPRRRERGAGTGRSCRNVTAPSACSQRHDDAAKPPRWKSWRRRKRYGGAYLDDAARTREGSGMAEAPAHAPPPEAARRLLSPLRGGRAFPIPTECNTPHNRGGRRVGDVSSRRCGCSGSPRRPAPVIELFSETVSIGLPVPAPLLAAPYGRIRGWPEVIGIARRGESHVLDFLRVEVRRQSARITGESRWRKKTPLGGE